MGRLQTKTADCDYNEYDRRLSVQFTYGLDDECMTSEITKNYQHTDGTNNEWFLLHSQRVEVQIVQKEALDNIKGVKDFDSIRWNIPKEYVRHMKQKCIKSCQSCSTGHPQRQCPAYGKTCIRCGKTNLSSAVCRWMQRQCKGHNLPKSGRSVHKARQEEEPHVLEQKQHNKSFYLVNIRYFKLDNVKSSIFTKLELSNIKKGVHNIKTRFHKQCIPNAIQNFRTLFPKSTMDTLHVTKTIH